MKLSNAIISAISPLSLFILSSTTASADTFKMKDGSSINATIISETNDKYLLRAEVSNNVYGEKTVLKSNVLEISKVDPSIEAFKKLSSILPTPDLMSTKQYETIITTKLKPFIQKYPESPHLNEAEKILNTLNAEYHTIKSGGIKINEKIHTPQQIEANQYDIQASIEYHRFIAYAKKKQFRAALSILENLETNYPSTPLCRKAQRLALTILPLYEKKLKKLHDNADAFLEKRNIALEGMNPGDQTRTSKLFAQEDQQYQELLQESIANNNKIKWLPINPYFKEPIAKNLKMVPIHTKKINTDLEKPAVDTGAYYRDTHTALEAGDYPTAKDHFEQFKRTKPPELLLNHLETRLTEAKLVMQELEEQQKAEEKLAKEQEKLAKQQAVEERKRIAQEERDSKKNKKTKTPKKEKLDPKEDTKTSPSPE